MKLFEHFEEYERLYRVLLGGRGSPWFAKKMRARLSEARGEREQERAGTPIGKRAGGPGPEASGFVSTFIDALIIDTVVWWLEQGRPYPPRQVAAYSWRLIVSVLKEASTWQ